MKGKERILIVEDETVLGEVLQQELERRGMSVTLARTGREAIAGSGRRFDAVLLDLGLPDMDGLEVFKALGGEAHSPEVVILTGQGQVGSAVEAMKLGAYDYLEKPMDVGRIHLVLKKASEKCRLRLDNLRLTRERDQAQGFELVVRSGRTIEAMDLARKVAASDVPVLILGETGTGKDVLARIIHDSSPRSASPFVAINCTALQQAILENELFGHERGAFTDARETKPGFFEIASGGTLFLDEIGDMGTNLQSKLLRVIESGSFYRVGGTRLVQTDTRLITATNQDLVEKVKQGSFRQDLFYRINTFPITLPPLRERREEILPLAESFLRLTGTRKRLAPDAMAALVQGYGWPGNVRELKHVIQRSVLVSSGEVIGASDLCFPMASRRSASPVIGSLDEMERAHIQSVLEFTQGNLRRASEILGISTKTLSRKVQRFRTDSGRS